ALATPAATLERLGGDPARPFLASMGIYLFRRRALARLLEEEAGIDFGRDLIPAAIDRYRVVAHYFDGYWEDVGTISAYYRSQLMLSEAPHPAFLFHGTQSSRIFSRGRYLPASRCMGAVIDHATLADGCVLHEGCEIRHSLLGLRTIVRPGSRVVDSVVNGADFYAHQTEAANPREGRPYVGIGRDCLIERAILDKNVRLGDGVTIRGAEGRPDEDHEDYAVRDGIVIVAKNAVIPSGTTL
ncbi:MAG: glucose-1-phosphate adenylyltransferase, partial [Nitrospirae bacterium]